MTKTAKIERKVKKYLTEIAKEEQMTLQEAIDTVKADWGICALHGYGIFENDFMPNIEVIERIDEMNIYDSDIDAGEQAKLDFNNGICIAFDIFKIEDEYPQLNYYPYNAYMYIDTEENRKELEMIIEKERNCDNNGND